MGFDGTSGCPLNDFSDVIKQRMCVIYSHKWIEFLKGMGGELATTKLVGLKDVSKAELVEIFF